MEGWISLIISSLTIYLMIGVLEGMCIIYARHFKPTIVRYGPNLDTNLKHLHLSYLETLLVVALLWPFLLLMHSSQPDPPDPDDKESIKSSNVIYVDFSKRKKQDEDLSKAA